MLFLYTFIFHPTICLFLKLTHFSLPVVLSGPLALALVVTEIYLQNLMKVIPSRCTVSYSAVGSLHIMQGGEKFPKFAQKLFFGSLPHKPPPFFQL